MKGLVLLALLVGGLLSVGLTVLPFTLGLTGVTALGLALAAVRHVPFCHALGGCLTLAAAAQVGFGLGLATRAILRGR